MNETVTNAIGHLTTSTYGTSAAVSEESISHYYRSHLRVRVYTTFALRVTEFGH